MKKIIVIILFSYFLFTPVTANAQPAVTGTFSCKWVTGTPGYCMIDFDNINCVSTSEGSYFTDVMACNGFTSSSCPSYNQNCIVDPTGVTPPPPVPAPYAAPPDHSSFSLDVTKFSDFARSPGNQIVKPELTTINGIISAFLPYIISFSGLILFLMLISGGFTMLTAVSDPKAADAGKQRITSAIMGFLILFSAYWIIQILEIILGINILGA